MCSMVVIKKKMLNFYLNGFYQIDDTVFSSTVLLCESAEC